MHTQFPQLGERQSERDSVAKAGAQKRRIDMSINSTGTTHYMSNASIMEWMEAKTERLYEQMGTAMDQSNSRVDAEDALTDIKGKIEDLKANGGDATPLRELLDETIKKYGAEFPEVGEALQPIADELAQRAGDNQYQALNSNTAPNTLPGTRSGTVPGPTPSPNNRPGATHNTRIGPPPLKVSSEDADRWSNKIKDKIDTLGKQDQLGMVHLQDLNGQLNRAKDVASALMASADKAADNIVSHIG